MNIKIKRSLIFVLFVVVMILQMPGYAKTAKYDSISKKYGFTLQEEVEIGFQTSLTLIRQYGIYRNPRVNEYVSRIGETIVKKFSKRPDITYRFIVLDTSEINAFAAPGGFIFITRGTLSIMDNEAELVAVISHEVTHVEEGDGLAAIASDPGLKEKLRITAALTSKGKSLSKQYLEELDKEVKNTRNESGNNMNFDVKNEVDNLFKNKTTN